MLSVEDPGFVIPAVLERLHDDHVRLERVMRVLEREFDFLGVGEGPDYSLVATIIDYIRCYSDAVHHPLEDLVFDRLLHKGVTPAERHVAFLNLGKHQEIIEYSRKLQDDVRAILDGCVAETDKIADDVNRYLSQQRKHMAFEELHLFPLVESRLEDRDWDLIDAETTHSPDPLFESRLENFRKLHEKIVATER